MAIKYNDNGSIIIDKDNVKYTEVTCNDCGAVFSVLIGACPRCKCTLVQLGDLNE